ncbi:hemerythrin domain-containing protein [Amycolatopsis tolypomycina]|uniref:hemerythrin domain-containing protein n=1 Tax=Amycolatopsis tolypomycina TaxID=208445 RepID=UPI0033B23F1D
MDLLLAQHGEIKKMIERVRTAESDVKQAVFEDLVRLLAVHESAEEIVVHPTSQRVVGTGSAIVADRLTEENEAKHVLAELYRLGADHPDFDGRFAEFAESVVEHAEQEEAEEFPLLRERMSPDDLMRMAGALRAAEAAAPTRPHPRVGESAKVNLLAGPPLGVFDRVRDGVRDWLGTRV